MAGLTLVAIAVPEQMATARLANMAAVTGLYAFVAGSLLFALFGRSRHMSVGADSTIAPIIAAGVTAVAAVGTPPYTHLVSFLALMVGALVIAAGLLRLGWIADFLSRPVAIGVLAGIAIEIVVRQLPAILGVAGGGTTTVSRVRKVADQIGHVNGWSVAIAVGVFVVIIVAEHVSRRIPGALIGVVGSTVVVSALGLRSHGVVVLGPIHGGLPSFGVPSASWADARHLVVPALIIAFVCVAQTAATARTTSAESPAADDFNRDLVALGAGSVAAGLSGSFAVNSSPPRTEVVIASGGRSQLTSVVAAVVALGVVLVATGLLKDLPQATLGAVLVFVATGCFTWASCGRSCASIGWSSVWHSSPSWPCHSWASSRAWAWPCCCLWPTEPDGRPGPKTPSSADCRAHGPLDPDRRGARDRAGSRCDRVLALCPAVVRQRRLSQAVGLPDR